MYGARSVRSAVTGPETVAESLSKTDFYATVDSVDLDGGEAQIAAFERSIQGFPRDGESFGVLSSGGAPAAAGDPETFLSTYTEGSVSISNGSPGGYDAFNVVTLTLRFTVPEDAEDLEFGYRFATEELPTYSSSGYQDFFTATVVRPDGSEENIALLPDGDPVTVDNARPYANDPNGTSTDPEPPLPEPQDTAFNAVTDVVNANFDVSDLQGEELALELRVGDASDSSLDSAAFVDGLGYGSRCPVGELADTKLGLVDDIRSEIPPIYLIDGQTVEQRPEQFAQEAKANAGSYASGESSQYCEGLHRLIETERVTQKAVTDAAEEIIPQTSRVIANAVKTAATGIARNKVTRGLTGKAKGFLIGRSVRQAKSVKNSIASPAAVGGATGAAVTTQLARSEAEFATAYRRAVDDYAEEIESTADDVVETGLGDLTPGEAESHFEGLPDDITDDVLRIESRLTSAIEGLFFQFFYFSADPFEFELDVPDVDIPDEVSFTVDVPSQVDGVPGVPDEISASVDLPEEEINETVDELSADLDRIIELVDFVEGLGIITSPGIDPVLDDGTDVVRNRAERGELERQDESERVAVRDKARDTIDSITGLTDGVLSVTDGISKGLSLVTAVLVSIAVVVLLAFLGKALLTLTGVAVTSSYLTSVGGWLAYLGLASSVLVLINYASVSLYLRSVGQTHFASAVSILATDLGGVSE